MSNAVSHARQQGKLLDLEEILLVSAIAYFIALKLFLVFALFPIPDEAYYWMWGRHPALSYFDHPPLSGWVQGLIHAVLGRSVFALRLPGLIALAGTIWLFYRVARDIGGENWRLVLLRSLAAYLGTVLFGVFCTLAVPDYLLVFLLLASSYLFARYFGRVLDGSGGRAVDLFGAALLLGLAGLTKYNAVFLGLAIVAVVVTLPGLRRLLARPAIYLAGGLAVAMQAPILIWNLANDFGSLRYHLVDRQAVGASANGLLEFVLINIFVFSPFLLLPLARFFLHGTTQGFASAARGIAAWTFLGSSLVFLSMSAYSPVSLWWNVVAFVPALPFLGAHIGAFGSTLHAGWGIVVNTVVVATITIVAVLPLVGLPYALDTDIGSSWGRISTAVVVARDEHGADFVVSNRYESASQLGFVLDDPDVILLSARRTAFDDWTDETALRGRSAILVVDRADPAEGWRSAFGSVRLLETLTVPRLGSPQTYDIYLAEDSRTVGR